jgi:hypothetical protein
VLPLWQRVGMSSDGTPSQKCSNFWSWILN